jgi:hypothetical protein
LVGIVDGKGVPMEGEMAGEVDEKNVLFAVHVCRLIYSCQRRDEKTRKVESF